MAVVIETTLGDITVDLFVAERPQTCKNFLKLCKVKYYNFNLFHSVQSNFLAQTGDPTGTGNGGESIFGLVMGNEARYYEGEKTPKIRHNRPGLLSMVNCGNSMLGSQFFITLGADLASLDDHCVFAEVMEGQDVLLKLNETICDTMFRPYQDVRITHTIILEDPFEDLLGMIIPDVSPDRSQMIESGRIAADESIVEKEMSEIELAEMRAEREAKAQATILEIVGDLPEADAAPPENVLFVCKLNPVTTDEDLELIFRRFGNIKSCEVIRDKTTGDSLQYAFIEFEDKKACELAYEKMENTLIDDRRIHVDFSQSVAKLRWRGKGRGVEHINTNDASATNGRGQRNDERGSRGNSYLDNGRRIDDRKNYEKNSRNKSSSHGSSRRNESRRSKSRERSDDRSHTDRKERSGDRRKEIRKDGDDVSRHDRKESERNHRDDSKSMDKDYERKYEGDRGKDRDRVKDRERDRDRDKDRVREKDKERDRGRDRDKERVRDKDRDRDRERDRDRGRNRDKDRERDGDKDRERDRDKDRDKEKDRGRESRLSNRSNERNSDGRREEKKRKGSEDRSREEDISRRRDESSSRYSSESKRRREERSETRLSSSSKNDLLDDKKVNYRNSRTVDGVKGACVTDKYESSKEDKKAHPRSQSNFSPKENDRKLKNYETSEGRLLTVGSKDWTGKVSDESERIVLMETNHISPCSNNSSSCNPKINVTDKKESNSKKSKKTKHHSTSSSESSSDSSSSNSDSDSSSSSGDTTVAKKYYDHKGKLVRKVIMKKQRNKDSKRKSKRKNDKIVVIKKIKKKQASSDDDSESSSDESSDGKHRRSRKSKSAKKKSKRKHTDSGSDSSGSESSSKRKKKKSKKKNRRDSSSN